MPATQKILTLLAVGILAVGLEARTEAKDEIKAANARANELLKLDIVARAAFNKEHPGVLPELNLHLPMPTAVAFDWCNLNMVSQAHQQRSRDCWANAALEALECNYLIRNNRRLILSPQPILDHLKLGATDASMGADPVIACDYFLRTGTARLASYPYTGKPQEPKDMALPYRAEAWGYVSRNDRPPTVAQLKAALLKHGPLIVDLTDTAKFQAYTGGLFNEPAPIDKKDIKGKHAVLLVGWDDSRGEHGAWKIKNSWRPTWGEQGFMWIDRQSNDICSHAQWVRAASMYYSIPVDAFAKLVPEAKSLPTVSYVASPKPVQKSGPTSSIASADSRTTSPASATPLLAARQ